MRWSRGLPFCLVGSSCLRQLERECEARIAIVSMHRSIDPGCSDGNGLSIIEAIHMIVEDRSVLIPLQIHSTENLACYLIVIYTGDTLLIKSIRQVDLNRG